MKKQYLIIVLLTISMVCKAQDVNSFLKQISENNQELISYMKLLEARVNEAKTGNAPDNPLVTFGYMPGNTGTPGTKKIWSVNQSFHFPTKYLLQNKINKSNILLAEQEFKLGKMMTLLDAKLTMLQLIYNEKLVSCLLMRLEFYDVLLKAWKVMVDNGEATILEYNKITLELSSLNLQITKRMSDIKILKNKLLFMNGNVAGPYKNMSYPLEDVADIDSLISEKTENHPGFIIPEKEYLLSCEEMKLIKTGNLPELHMGYSSEIIPGETYSGPVAGFTIPLWQNSNKVKTAEAMADHSAAKRDAELARLKSEVLNEYFNMNALKKSYQETSEILSSTNSKKYLDIALLNREISLTTYFSDIGIIYQVEETLYELEYEYNRSIALLLDNKLIE